MNSVKEIIRTEKNKLSSESSDIKKAFKNNEVNEKEFCKQYILK
jgi:hypothetical protein